MDHRAIDPGRGHLGQRIIDREGRDLAMLRAHLAVLPEVDLGIDDQHGVLLRGTAYRNATILWRLSIQSSGGDRDQDPHAPPARPVMEIARELLPPGMELVVADPGKPEFYDAAVDAEYYLGSPRSGIGNEFFRAAPKLKLVQLTSAGYDRDDIEAARKAGVPVANNGGANSVAVAEHAVMLMLAVLKRLVYHHNNV